MIGLARFSPDWPSLSALLDQALDLPTSEHAAWLAGLKGDSAAHRDELRALLAQRAGVETDDFLAELPRLPAQPPSGAGSTPEPGARVGAYRLISAIGEGGMGTVWLAERADGIMKRRVALKLPRVAWGDGLAARLAYEREILASLEHQHIARLYDAGVDAHGRPFLAMEYVAGEPIDEDATSRSLSLRRRVELLLQAAAAVAHAHSRLVVHRDIKPGNILVTPQGQAKLLDFGIAKLLEPDGRGQSPTELHGRAYTPQYASPEQIRGEALGTASDVYSLGVVAYQLLTGKLPYRLRRGTPAEIEDAIAGAEPRLASEAADTPALRKALHGDLDAILHRALKKSVAERYPSAEAFAQDLQRWLRGEPVLARPDSRRYRFAKFVRRNRFAVAMSSALAASVLAGATIALWQTHVAREQEALAGREADRQRAVRDLYVETLTTLAVAGAQDPRALAQPGAITAALRDKLRDMAPRFDKRPAEREAQLEALVFQFNYANDFESSLAVGREHLALLKATGARPQQVIGAYATMGRNLFQLKRLDECEAIRREGLAWAPRARDPRTEASRLGLAEDLGGLLTMRGKRDEARNLLLDAEARAARLPGETHLHADILARLSLFQLGFDDELALAYARQAHAGVVAAGTADPDQEAYDLLHFGEALAAHGQLAEAERMLRKALDIYALNYGPASWNTIATLGRLAGTISREGEYGRARALLTDSREALRALPGGLSGAVEMSLRTREIENAWLAGDSAASSPLSPSERDAMLRANAPDAARLLAVDQARLWMLAGRGQDALALLHAEQTAWAGADRVTEPAMRLRETLAMAQLAAGEASGALQTARDLMDSLTRQGARGGRGYVVAGELAALAAARLGDPREAARLRSLVDAYPAPAFPSHVEHAESSLRRAEVLLALGRKVDAAALGRDALADLVGQHPASPRLERARQLAALATS